MTEELVKGGQRPPADTEPEDTVSGIEGPTEAEPGDLTDSIEEEKMKEEAPAAHELYLFDKDIECPVCGHWFSVKMVRSSKLTMKGLQPDLRQCYYDFEPLWYMIWACPSCCYANFNYQFKQITEDQKDKILRDQLQREKGVLQKLKVIYSSPRTFSQVLKGYELLQANLSFITPDPEQYSKFWLRLSWLYSDAGNTAMYEKASAKALEYYQEIYFNSRTTSADQEARLALILGNLHFRLKNYDEAAKYVHKAIIKRGGNPVVNRQAEDLLEEIKKLKKGGKLT